MGRTTFAKATPSFVGRGDWPQSPAGGSV